MGKMTSWRERLGVPAPDDDCLGGGGSETAMVLVSVSGDLPGYGAFAVAVESENGILLPVAPSEVKTLRACWSGPGLYVCGFSWEEVEGQLGLEYSLDEIEFVEKDERADGYKAMFDRLARLDSFIMPH